MKSEEYWKEKLSTKQYRILRLKGTELPFSGENNSHKEKGNYYCAGCGEVIFNSEGKFDSGCGWPSFFTPADSGKIKTEKDMSHGMNRIEIMCKKCGGHLGHVFEDGPKPTGLRYCVNSLSLEFVKCYN